MNKSELKPCPFCGGEAIVLHWDGTDTFSVGCVNTFVCHGGTHTSRAYQSEQEAAEAWNRRVELTGEWMEDEYGYCRCSLCGYEHDDPETTTPYCPNCGAKMESEDKMTYLELADESARDLDRGKITLGEYEERIKPLCDEIKPWNGWISTSERLPEKFENVLLSTNGGLVEEGLYFETTEFHAIWKGVVTHGTYWDDEITAWMPLPEPYHAESEDK